MKATLYMTWHVTKLYMRTKASLFTMIVMPMALFFVYMSLFAAGRPEKIVAFLGPVFVLMATTNGIYGISGDLLIMRETGTLLSYQLTPVTPLQILASRLIVDCVLTLLVGTSEVLLAVGVYRMPLRAAPVDLFLIALLATLALGAFGAVIISVTDGFPQASMLSQILFLALLILSGMSVPLASLPVTAQRVAQFLPTTMLVTAFNGVLVKGDALVIHWREIVVIILFILACAGVASTLFRWDREQKATTRGRVLASISLIPLILSGVWFNLR